MKVTGIARRVDDLGRVVIPKEICKTMSWVEGDAIEMYVDPENNTLVLKKYSADTLCAKFKELRRQMIDEMTISDYEEIKEKLAAIAKIAEKYS